MGGNDCAKPNGPTEGFKTGAPVGSFLPAFALDATDFRILRELFLGDLDFLRSDRVPLDEVARRLGIHRNTVSARVRRLREHRIYLPMAIGINDPAVGLTMGMAFLKVPPSRRDDGTADQVFALGGVSNIFFYLDGWHVLLHASTSARLESLLEEVTLATGTLEAKWDFFLKERPGMPAPAPLSALEARVIGMLYRDSRQAFSRIGAAASVTARTAENVYRRLRERGVIFQTPGPVSGYPGMAAAYLRIELRGATNEQEQVRGQVLNLIENDFVRMLQPVGPLNLYVYGASNAQLEGQAARLSQVRGVDRVELRVLVRKRANPGFPDWIEEYLLDRTGLSAVTAAPRLR